MKGCSESTPTAVSFQIGGSAIEKRIHGHAPDPARAELLAAVNCILESSAATNYAPRRIISEVEISHEAQSLAAKRNQCPQELFGEGGVRNFVMELSHKIAQAYLQILEKKCNSQP